MNRMPTIYLGVFPQESVVLFNTPRDLENQSPSLSMNQEYCKLEDRISLKKGTYDSVSCCFTVFQELLSHLICQIKGHSFIGLLAYTIVWIFRI